MCTRGQKTREGAASAVRHRHIPDPCKTPDIPSPETRSPSKARGPHRTNRLNPRAVPKLAPGTHFDGNGLLLVVRPSGSRSWVQRLVVRGKRVDIGLGGFPTTSLSEARRAPSKTAASPATAATRANRKQRGR